MEVIYLDNDSKIININSRRKKLDDDNDMNGFMINNFLSSRIVVSCYLPQIRKLTQKNRYRRDL